MISNPNDLSWGLPDFQTTTTGGVVDQTRDISGKKHILLLHHLLFRRWLRRFGRLRRFRRAAAEAAGRRRWRAGRGFRAWAFAEPEAQGRRGLPGHPRRIARKRRLGVEAKPEARWAKEKIRHGGLGPPVERLKISWYQLLCVVHFSRGTLPKKKGKRALLGDLEEVTGEAQVRVLNRTCKCQGVLNRINLEHVENKVGKAQHLYGSWDGLKMLTQFLQIWQLEPVSYSPKKGTVKKPQPYVLLQVYITLAQIDR